MVITAGMRCATVLLVILLGANLKVAAQGTDPNAVVSPAGVSPAPVVGPSLIDAARPVDWRMLAPNLFSDQKKIWLFPKKLTQRKALVRTAVVAGITGGLVLFDAHEAPWFLKNSSFDGFNRAFSSEHTEFGTVAVPVAMYAAGLLRKDKKLRSTAMLAGEAVGDFEILGTVMKDVTQRSRPAAVPTGGNYSDTWFNSPGSVLQSHGSFPSAHEGAAFAVATVIARRYGNHKWVPWTAYGLAAVVGLSRMSLGAHFASDVFVGGVLGYSIGRFAVLRQ